MTLSSAHDFLAVLRGGSFLTEAQLEELSKQQTETTDARTLARWLLQRDWLTPYQVNQILQGRSKDLLLGTYMLLERLGEGGMGQVFKARHPMMQRIVAIKLIRKECLSYADAIPRFFREVRAAAQLHHPNIVLAHDAARAGETYYLVMEYVEGSDLAKVVKSEGQLSIRAACDYIRQAALGLQHAHERGQVHRDIKPQNLIRTARGEIIKILDMGLARVEQGDDTAADLTREGSIMGTPDYMAPEQAEESHTVDARADIYSLGCSLFYLLSARAPFAGGTLAQKLRKHQQAERPSLLALRADIPPSLDSLVRRLMARRPEERPQTAAEVAEALGVFVGAAPPLAIPVSRTSSRDEATVALRAPLAIPLGKASELAAPQAIPVAAVALSPHEDSGETLRPAQQESFATLDTPTPAHLPQRRRRWPLVAAVSAAGFVVLLLLLFLRPGKKPSPAPERLLAPADALTWETIPPLDRDQEGQQKDLLVGVLGAHRLLSPTLHCLALSPDGKHVAIAGNDGIQVGDTETLHPRNKFPAEGGLFTLLLSPRTARPLLPRTRTRPSGCGTRRAARS